jgi:hypothetical protein
MTMTEIKLYKSPKRVVKLVFLSTIFVATGYWLINYTDSPKWVGWSSILFFGLGYPVAIFHLFDRRVQIIINEIGIYDRTTHKDFINWDIIKGAKLTDVHGQKFICLDIDETLAPYLKNKRQLSVAMGFGKLNISLGQINIDPEKLLEFIGELLNADKEQRKKVVKENLKLNGR